MRAGTERDAMSTDATILRQLIASCPPSPPAPANLLNDLVAAAPSRALITQRKTLFDVLDVANQETAHSYFLTWLLDPNGPLTGSWLLRRLLARVLPQMSWPGAPHAVEAEVAEGGDRPDVLVRWERYTLLIEYKIDSPETKKQVCRYLKRFVGSPSEGVVVYITKDGDWPPSVEPGDPRVRTVSYEDLAEIVQSGLNGGIEPSDRGRVLLQEFHNCLARSIHRSFGMEKPVFSDGTKLLSAPF